MGRVVCLISAFLPACIMLCQIRHTKYGVKNILLPAGWYFSLGSCWASVAKESLNFIDDLKNTEDNG